MNLNDFEPSQRKVGSYLYYPVVISLKADNFHSFTYFETKNNKLKPIKRVIVQNGTIFELQDVFGLQSETSDDKFCCVCLTNEKNVLNKPCLHVALCSECAETLLKRHERKCPNCR